MHGDARIEGYYYCMPLETLLALNCNSFILTVGIIGIYYHARDMYGNSHSQGICVLLTIPSTLTLVQYFQSLCQGCQPPRLQILRIDGEGMIDDVIIHST